MRHAPGITIVQKYRNINLSSIAYSRFNGSWLRLDLPDLDERLVGNLGFSAVQILAGLSLLIPAFSLDAAPVRLTPGLHCNINAPLPLD